MDVRENWTQLNERMKDHPEVITELMRIHMGAFDDLRKNGHMITVDSQAVSVLAATLAPQDRFTLACQVGRGLIEAGSGLRNGHMAEICTIRLANCFPNCVAIAIGAILEYIQPGTQGFPGGKMAVECRYETVRGCGDPLGDNLKQLEKCFPWAEFSMIRTEEEPPPPVSYPVLPLDRMPVLFRADGVLKIALGRTSFSGTVLRGEIRKGDILTVTDGRGQQICPPGVVMRLMLKDRVENGVPVGEEADTATPGRHYDSVLLAVDLPQGRYNGLALCRQENRAR